MEAEVKAHEERIKNLKDEIGRLEFQLTMLKNNYNDVAQRTLFRSIAKEERKLSSSLTYLEAKVKDHGPTCTIGQEMIGIIENIKCASKHISEDTNKLQKQWCFNGDFILQEKEINMNPKSQKEALEILPKLGVAWPPKATKNARYSNEVDRPITPFEGRSVLLVSLDSQQFRNIQPFYDSAEFQRRLIWGIGKSLNDLCSKLHIQHSLRTADYEATVNKLRKNNVVLRWMHEDISRTSFDDQNPYSMSQQSTNSQELQSKGTQTDTQPSRRSKPITPTTPITQRKREALGPMGDILHNMENPYSRRHLN